MRQSSIVGARQPLAQLGAVEISRRRVDFTGADQALKFLRGRFRLFARKLGTRVQLVGIAANDPAHRLLQFPGPLWLFALGQRMNALGLRKIAELFQPCFQIVEFGDRLRAQITLRRHMSHQRAILDRRRKGDDPVAFAVRGGGKHLLVGLDVLIVQHTDERTRRCKTDIGGKRERARSGNDEDAQHADGHAGTPKLKGEGRRSSHKRARCRTQAASLRSPRIHERTEGAAIP